MATTQLQTMRDRLNAHRMAISAELYAVSHFLIHVMASLDQRRLPV
jgi:hypothetical protein